MGEFNNCLLAEYIYIYIYIYINPDTLITGLLYMLFLACQTQSDVQTSKQTDLK